MQVLAVVQYFQNRDAPDNAEEEIWQKMAGAGPSIHMSAASPPIGSGEMSREPSHDAPGRVDHFANPVSNLYTLSDLNSQLSVLLLYLPTR